jgi:DNA polymerase-3 subunit delta
LSKSLRLVVGGKDYDAYLAEQTLERILDETIGGDRSDSLQGFRGDEASWAQVADAARTRSLFASRKAIVVRQAEALRGDEQPLLEYLKDPTPGITLVLVAAKVDKRKTGWKRLFEAADVSLAEPLKGARLRGYVAAELRRRKLELGADAVEALIDRVGADLRRLIGEVDKLQAYAEGERLSAEEVAKVLGRGFARPLYELTDAFCERRAADALALTERALDEGEAPLRILAALFRSLRQLRAARALQDAGTPKDEIARRLLPGNMAFKLPSLLESARRWSEPLFVSATLALDGADRGIKTGAEARAALAASLALAFSGTATRPSPFPTR